MALDVSSPSTPERPAARTSAGRRIAALDGLRALAVVAVILYHAGIGWAQGGFIGVDVFFVLSGYLMASITLEAVARRGGLGLRRFWKGRIRRLMPAQVALMTVTTLVVLLWVRDELYGLRGQVVAGLTATMNWYLIATNGSYFEQLGRPPLLRHLWSLAIEMQFYLVFPPLLAVLLVHNRVPRHRIVQGILVLAAASAVWMAILFHPGQDPSRAYYDTFARFGAPLLGAALALVWRPQQIRRAPAMAAARQVTAASVAALALLGVVVVRVSDRSEWMYRGGFLLVAVLTAVVLAGLTHPGSPLGGRRALGHPLLVAVGLRSYSLYLWHWPIFVLLRPRVDVHWSTAVTFWVRIALTVVAAELCYRLVERPWHQRSPNTYLRTLVASHRSLTPRARRTALASVAALAAAAAALALAQPSPDPIAESLRAGSSALAATSTSSPAPTASTEPGQTTVPGDTSTTTTTTTPAQANRVTFVGDSVMLGAAPALLDQFGAEARVDAKVSRQASAVPDVLRAMAAQGPLGKAVVVHIGNNGTISADDMADIVDLAGTAKVYFVNVRVPRSWEGEVNTTLNAEAPKLKAKVINWRGLAESHPDWFYDDGIHLKPGAGQDAYAQLIAQAVGA